MDSIDLLWTNPSPSASFAPQTLPLDLSKYKSVLIRCKLNASPYVYDFAQDYSKFSIPDATRRCAATAYGKIDGGWYYTLGYRNATVSKSGITFETGYYYETGNHVLVPSDAFCVPQAIYGIASDNF